MSALPASRISTSGLLEKSVGETCTVCVDRKTYVAKIAAVGKYICNCSHYYVCSHTHTCTSMPTHTCIRTCIHNNYVQFMYYTLSFGVMFMCILPMVIGTEQEMKTLEQKFIDGVYSPFGEPTDTRAHSPHPPPPPPQGPHHSFHKESMPTSKKEEERLW